MPTKSAATAPARSVTVRVPASTSNLGPGFDTLGVALKLYNRIRLEPCAGKSVLIVSPLDAGRRAGASAMVAEAAATFFKHTRQAAFGLRISLEGEIPLSRGLGSSATLRLGVIAGLNALAGTGLDPLQIMHLVTGLEHHPDNAAPATLGGFTAAGLVDGEVRCLRFPVSPRLKFVTLIPHYEISTVKARQLVPPTFSRADTVHNLNRSALISAAFASAQYEALHGLLEDRVHQPFREQLIPQLNRIIRAGEKAGAIGGWLCGSGPAVVCVTLQQADAVAAAMQRQLRDSDVHILAADNEGVKILASKK
jgi:homoserine kinase